MEKLFLDSNIIVDFLVNDSKEFDLSTDLYSSTINIFEIKDWIKTQTSLVKSKWEEFRKKLTILEFDESASNEFYKLKNKLSLENKVKYDKDLQIAAICIVHALTLVTKDKFFENLTASIKVKIL